jgi:hypothetical protein
MFMATAVLAVTHAVVGIGAVIDGASAAGHLGYFKSVLVLRADCEDVETVPCVTVDEGEWRMVTSYRPYRKLSLRVCKSVVPKNAPCVFTKKNRAGMYVVALRK